MEINQLIYKAHQNAIDKGWWGEERSFGELVALIHSEVSEALEDYRSGHEPDEVWYENGDRTCGSQLTESWKPCGIPSELADICIRVFDLCGHYDIDLEKAIIEKMAYNATRPQKHGGKVL